MTELATPRQIRLERISPLYWRVTFDHPPLNIFGYETIPQLDEIIRLIERDQDLKVVVFDSAVEGFFLTHFDFLGKPEDLPALPPGATGLQPLPDMLARLSRAPVASIASIRGRATGVGSELALACDMRFASREKAILSQWEVGAGLVPGGGPLARLPRLIGRGRALEVLFERRRYQRRSRGALRLCQSCTAGFRPRCFCRCTCEADMRRSTNRPSTRPSVW